MLLAAREGEVLEFLGTRRPPDFLARADVACQATDIVRVSAIFAEVASRPHAHPRHASVAA